MLSLVLTEGEAILLDWVLTAHQHDRDLLDRLTRRYWPYRRAVADILIHKTDKLELERADVEHATFEEVVALVPAIFVYGGENVGLSLKTKLYTLLFSSMGGLVEEEAGKEEIDHGDDQD